MEFNMEFALVVRPDFNFLLRLLLLLLQRHSSDHLRAAPAFCALQASVVSAPPTPTAAPQPLNSPSAPPTMQPSPLCPHM